jgi:hypothetical protein
MLAGTVNNLPRRFWIDDRATGSITKSTNSATIESSITAKNAVITPLISGSGDPGEQSTHAGEPN